MTASDNDFDPEFCAGSSSESSSVSKPLSLPAVSTTPTTHPGCCLTLSAPLLVYLAMLLPSQPRAALSIGSGYGLLEALLLAEPYNRNVVGVEVEPSPNRYLPAPQHRVVHGTRFLEPLAADACTWLFVYPRRVGLVQEYLAEYGAGALDRVIWIGPVVDWDDYKACFEGAWQMQVKSAAEAGGSTWETIAVAQKGD